MSKRSRKGPVAQAAGVRSAHPQRGGRRRLFLLLLLLFGLILLWARGPLERRWLQQLPLSDLEAYAAEHPDRRDAVLLLARRYLRAGSAAAAETLLRRLLETRPDDAEAWLLRSQAEFEQGKLAPAYASLNVAMPFLQREPDAHWRLGLLLERRGDERGAEEAFRRALALDRDHVGANLELARSALAHRHYGPAVEHLQRVIRWEPGNTTALQLLSRTYLFLGDPRRAEEHARRATRLAPDLPDAWQALGEALQALATPEALAAAEDAYRRALQLDPQASDVWHQLGKIYVSRGDFARAAPLLQRAVDLRPLNRLPYPALIQAYLRLGQRARAERVRREYERINAMDLSTAPLEYSIYAMPQNTALRMRLARLYLKYGRPDLALEQVERVLELNPAHGEARRLRRRLRESK